MNLNAYDPVETKCDKGSWINPIYKRLYSKDIEYHPYCAFLKRYNTKLKCTDYFLAMLDNQDNNSDCHGVVRTNGIVKIDLKPIWNTTSLVSLKERTLTSLEEIEKSDDGVIYQLNV